VDCSKETRAEIFAAVEPKVSEGLMNFQREAVVHFSFGYHRWRTIRFVWYSPAQITPHSLCSLTMSSSQVMTWE
jgi:hypothetical protein